MLILLSFLLPLWFLPFTQNILGYPKQVLLVIAVFAAFGIWLAGQMRSGTFTLRWGMLHWGAGAFLAATGISSIFSIWRYGSFWGWPLDIADSFLSVLCFAALFWLMSQQKEVRVIFSMATAFLVSSALAIVFAFLQFKGIFVLPLQSLQTANFQTLGTPNSIALLAGILVPLALGLSRSSQMFVRIGFTALALVLFGIAAFFNFADAWIVIMVGLGVLLAFEVSNKREHLQSFGTSLIMILIVVSVCFFFLRDFALPGAPSTPAEVSLNYAGEMEVIKGMAQENPLRILVGTGPGTFEFAYSLYRSASSNNSLFWNTRFSGGVAEGPDFLVTHGIAGFSAFLLLIILGAGFGTHWLYSQSAARKEVSAPKRVLKTLAQSSRIARVDLNKTGSGEMNMGVQEHALLTAMLAAFCAIVVAFFLYPGNIILWFLFWMLVGGIAFFISSKEFAFAFSRSPFVSLGVSFALLSVFVAQCGVLIIGGKGYAAQVSYAKAIHAARENKSQEAVRYLQSAVKQNGSVDVYQRELAQLFVIEGNRIAADSSLQGEERAQKVGAMVQGAIAAARKASSLVPENVANWNVQGVIYRNLIGVVGAENFAIESFQRAAQREPSSPFPWTEMARVRILQVQAADQNKAGAPSDERAKQVDEAVTYLGKAIALKGDYAAAHYLLAVAYSQQGKAQEAISKLEETKRIAPNDIGIAFQLGVIYRQEKNLPKAAAEFERAAILNPNYANARYMLGLVYDAQGKTLEALIEFEKVEELNPANEEVQKIIANLRNGKAALDGVSAQVSPLEENPPELSESEE
ncbi:MAG: hypothetical protein A3C04_02485 [Candidatus Wildermuthbacteria bacterium RIFCSPHIGHO2_02_FULL_45_25]|uniref:Uncharacterized protein n=1 Tax=Candidatus Wildermuthbacteria bacterium RIFCSPHIGHO2_02_FULL_45_25 TaxID=1802450 RepID=A0A1G2R1Y0_9BACT|nr:MAG: hypothetical protein A3C04_02485 [Candidatus Wildermuthbacteria bacterium RIFCSPHIGHO2_02_FULL_45_25]